jgi:hypothetical protein
MGVLDGVNTGSLPSSGCESFTEVRCTGFTDGDFPRGIYPWVSALVMGNLMGRRFGLRCENRPANRPASRETGLEMPCCPASDLLWVQITQSYPNRLRFSSLPCPQSPCHAVIEPVFKEGFFPKVKTSFPTKPFAGLSRAQKVGEECSAHLLQTFPEKNWSIPVF